MEASFVEEVAASLVREFLSKKGLKKTGIMMDEEFPRTALSINNRNELRNVLHLQSLYKQNKAKETPFKTILEIMASYFLELQINQSFLGNSSFLENKASHARSTESFPPKNFLSGEATGGQTAAEKIKKGTPSYEINEGISCLSRRHCPKPSEKGKARATSDGQAQAEGEKKLCDPLDVSQIPGELPTETRMALREKLRGQSNVLPPQGRIAASTDESQEDSLKRKKRLSGICSPSKFSQEATFKSSTSLPGHSCERTIIPRPLDELLSARSARQNSSLDSPWTRCAKKDDSTVQNVDSSREDPLTKPGLDKPAEANKIVPGYDAYEKRRPLDVFRKEMGSRSGVKSLQKNEAPFTDLRSAPGGGGFLLNEAF
ncbi:putative protein-like [Crotalus adamanteus]|uniref:MINDY4 N-terminal dimerisation domain-containing protein n=1 Tax=Crotalus adamanteus TaxID=8729 RepID=A0AAW1B1S7_CROAD